jgi:hypothetical protein
VFFEISSYALGFGLNPNIKIRALASSQYGLPGAHQDDSLQDDDGTVPSIVQAKKWSGGKRMKQIVCFVG